MTVHNDKLHGLDAFCAACEQPLTGPHHAEWLATPLGLCYARTHPVAGCVEGARALRAGRPVELGPTSAERVSAKVAQGRLPIDGKEKRA